MGNRVAVFCKHVAYRRINAAVFHAELGEPPSIARRQTKPAQGRHKLQQAEVVLRVLPVAVLPSPGRRQDTDCLIPADPGR